MASTASVTFTSYSNYIYSEEQGTPFVINILSDADASSIDPQVSSVLPPPPPPNASDGGFDNLNYYSTGFVVLDSKKSRVTTVTTKGPDDPDSSLQRELKLKVFNKGYADTDSDNNVYFQVNADALSGSFTNFKIVDSSSNVVDVIGAPLSDGKRSFSLPRMTDDTEEYSIKYITKTNIVAAIASFEDKVNGTSKTINENLGENVEVFAFTATTVYGDEVTTGATYEFISGNEAGHFKIVNNKVYTSSTSINYESPTVSITLKIKGTMGGTASAQYDFIVTITDLNDIPTDLSFTKISEDVLTNSTGKVGDLSITDEDALLDFNSYTYEIYNKGTTDAHDKLELKNQTEVHIKSGIFLSAGNTEFSVIATGTDSSAGHSLMKDFLFAVLQEDRPPSGSIPDQTHAEDSGPHTITLSDYITDLDNDAITFTLGETHNTDLLTISLDDASLTYTLKENAHGNTNIAVTASANGETINVSFNVVVTSVNDSPVYNGSLTSTIDITSGDTLSTYDLSEYFSDVDVGDTLTYSATSSDTNVATVSITGSILTITEVSPGTSERTSTINITVKDDSLASATHSISIIFRAAPRKRGDLNNNHTVTIEDLLFLQKYLNEVQAQEDLAANDSSFNTAADVNQDSSVDVADLVFLKNHLDGNSDYAIPGN